MKKRYFLAGLLCLAASIPAYARELVFAAPPRGSQEEETKVYQPIVDLISKVTGQKVSYRWTDNWLVYEHGMQKDEYDFVFDGPHFIGWRMEKYRHSPLLKLQGQLAFVVIARSDNARIQEIKDLAGRKICAFAPPNLATLTMYTYFDNPSRQPIIMEIKKGFNEAYEGVVSKRCEGGVLQKTLYEQKFNVGDKAGQTKVLVQTKPVPNQGLTASSRISSEMQRKIAAELLSAEGQKATAVLRGRFKKDLIPATQAEYEGLGVLLKDAFGFNR